MSDSEGTYRDVDVTIFQAQELSTLKCRRGVFKRKLTLFKKYIEAVDTKKLTAEIRIDIKLRLEKLPILFKEFSNEQDRIEMLCSDDAEIEEQVAERQSFEDSFYQLSAKANLMIQTDDVVGALDTSQQQTVVNESIKYPEIQLPSFSGDVRQWLEFRDTFNALVNQGNLQPIIKYKYLRSSLRGSALEVISSLDYSDDSYALAWQQLCERYNNPRILVFNHMKALFDIGPVPSTPAGLRGLSDNISKHVRTLRSLSIPVENWDLVIIYFLLDKLDSRLKSKWEEKIDSRKLPSLQEFRCFLRNRADLLETTGPAEQTHASTAFTKKAMVTTSEYTKVTSKPLHKPSRVCPYCTNTHFINQCPKFQALDVLARIRAVNKMHLCFNCLSGTHIITNCRASTCRLCKGKHHTLLHKPINPLPTNTPITTLANEQPSSNLASNTTLINNTQITKQIHPKTPDQTVILSTAQVLVKDMNGHTHKLRVLLDSGSQSNFITESAFNALQLDKKQQNLKVIGFNKSVSSIQSYCDVTVHSLDNTYTTQLTCFIVPSICNININFSSSECLRVPSRFKLADSKFCAPGEIDIIIGAEKFYDLLCIGQHRLGEGLPILQRTRFGWVVSGPVHFSKLKKSVQLNVSIESQLKKFWEIEEGSAPCLPYDEEQCEDIFSKTCTRNSKGNFVVELPLKSPVTELGKSRHIAYRRFKGLENKFQRNPELKEKYVQFMREFEQAGHMIKLNTCDRHCNFLPHQAVIRDSTTTPIRIVFDASCQTDSGLSLNDIQYKGSIQQDELINILIRFRQYQYVVNADIERMYRCIYLTPSQYHLQCIFWRENANQSLQIYALKTLSFGLKSAPHIATRCLLQLSHENKHTFPAAAETIKNQFYMDDLISGGEYEEQVAQIASQVDEILRGANFRLRKWKSNSENILQKVTKTPQPQHTSPTQFGDNTHKVLGLAWSNDSDQLIYTIKVNQLSPPITKRKVLSVISSIFDPLGLIGAVIIIAKLFIQQLFKVKSDWDIELTPDLTQEWNNFYSKIISLNKLRIPRCTVIHNHVVIELHGFADSSSKAYAAVIYIRSIDALGNIQVHLLYSKSKVAPIKTQTIPKLELLAALLLATHVKKVHQALTCHINCIGLWSDSSITLAWIKNPNLKLDCFVKNRVDKIKSLTKKDDWRWICSEQNPADILSRGIEPDKLADCTVWWHGPPWLARTRDAWPTHKESLEHAPAVGTSTTYVMATNTPTNDTMQYLFERWSSDTKLTHVLSYILRFIHNTKQKTRSLNPDKKLTGPLSVKELEMSRQTLIRQAQIESFPLEYNLLNDNKPIDNKSPILSLTPFMKDGLIHVGGRIGLSQYPFHKKHPYILSHEHTLTRLIMQNEHIRMLHAGPQLLLASIREHLWPTRGRTLAKQIVRKCVPCFKANPKTTNPIMGNLPPSRVNPSPPFHTTGLDYAGPFNVRDRKGRGYKVYKCYIAVFVCFVTKAIHLELVSGLESAKFIAALHRFIARRGKPRKLMSDNATTFHGAHNEMQDLCKFLTDSSSELAAQLADEGIEWGYIPVKTPHMGIWESCVRSCKYHLKRVLGKSLLTYEDFVTILNQVEAILNSRPLCPLPSSISETLVLTPAHFLIGRKQTALPDQNFTDVPQNRLTHYQHLQQLTQDFWKSWSRDYICTLQERTKWRSARGPSLTAGTVVLVREDRLPPCQWRLGRIIATHPGRDGVTRVATIKTAKGEMKRAFNNICPLPSPETV